jgi:hypothetical protein
MRWLKFIKGCKCRIEEEEEEVLSNCKSETKANSMTLPDCTRHQIKSFIYLNLSCLSFVNTSYRIEPKISVQVYFKFDVNITIQTF